MTKTEQQHIDHLKKLGAHFGYPSCCIESFCNRFFTSRPTELQAYVGKRTGFIPCEEHTKEILQGKTTLEGLISDRKHSLPFPQNDHELLLKELLHH